MGSQWDSEFADALAEVADDVEVVHIDSADTETEVSAAVWNPQRRENRRAEGDLQEVGTGVLTVAAAAIPTFTLDSSFRIDGVTYAVESVNGTTPLLEIELVESRGREAAMEQHRVRR